MIITVDEDIELIRKAGVIAGQVLEHIMNLVEPGITTWELDQAAGYLELPGALQPLSGSSSANQGGESWANFDERCGRVIAGVRYRRVNYFCRLSEWAAAGLLRLWPWGGADVSAIGGVRTKRMRTLHGDYDASTGVEVLCE